MQKLDLSTQHEGVPEKEPSELAQAGTVYKAGSIKID